ncbi:aminopeptidase Ey [Agrilus planipennis]|uniref:Aminopeptidase n=1 Tax=Agrilus planipennis TaxID=224129 RepID=A0A1W4XT18_AGRPL|nr:aminopeptidase Ey [Agrilus planipennis]
MRLLLSILLFAFAKGQIDEYRLSSAVIPSSYTIGLTVQSNFGETGVFQGETSIYLTVLEQTSTFEIHGSGLTITSNTLRTTQSSTNLISNIVYNSTTQKYTITTTSPLSIGTDHYFLTIAYNGILYDDMYGFYRSWYSDENGQTTWLATTQFEPTYARRAFPCFDEPNKKATFQVSITRPSTYRSLSNAPLESTVRVSANVERDTYQTTPIMSTYLVAFIVSDYASIYDPVDKNGVWSRKEAIGTGDYGFQIAPKLVAAYENYTGIEYLSTGIGKLDQVAIPDFGAGAMENWGLITYREYAILWDPSQSSHNYKESVATTIAHELAHMWFGDLVTCDWWSYTWLNEGFAQYMEYMMTARVETTWELEKQFVVTLVQGIFASDSTLSSQPLNANASTISEINYKFASLTYYKGASIIRMMRDFLGANRFRNAIQFYLSNHTFSTAVPDDLWEAMEAYSRDVDLPATVGQIMSTWTDQPGFPVVRVSLSGSTDVNITQQRFLLNNNNTSDLKYYVPISYTNSTAKDFETVSPRHWLLPNSNLQISNALPSSGWIVVNIQETGFYRVNYDETLWRRLASALKTANHDGIDVLNRAQIVDDSFNLARAGLLPYGVALDVTSYLSTETEYYPWVSALEALNHLRIRSANSTSLRSFLETHILDLISTVYEGLSFDYDPNESQADILKKVTILNLACELGLESCVSRANALFNNFKNNNVSVNPDTRTVVYCTALRTATSPDNWYFLWNRYLNTKLASEMNIILSTLGCTRNDTLRTEYLLKSITRDSGIRSQDSRSVFQSIYVRNLDGVDLAYNFFKTNFQSISSYYGGGTSVGTIVSGIASRFTNSEQIEDFEAFIQQNREILGGALSAAEGAVESARANVQWMNSYSDSILQWFVQTYGSSSGIPIFGRLLLVLSVIVIFIR